MSANFSVQFRINEKTQTRVIRLTDASSGFTLAKGNFSLTFPDGSTRIKTEWASPDITSPAAYIDILAVTDSNNNVITGSYKIDFIALDAATTSYSASKTFDFNWVKPTNSITDLSDVIIPQVQFKDNASYSPIGSFTGTVSRVFSVPFPTTSEASAQAATTTATNTLTPVYTGNYYEGVYNVSNDVTCNYTHSTNSWLTINYVELFTKSIAIKKCPNQLGLIEKLNTYRGVIEAYKEKNDTQFNILSEQYDLAIALYSHIIARYETSTQDGSEGQLRELLSILDPYTGSYTYQLTKMLPFELAASGANSFNISDGVNSDSVALGSSLLFSGGNAALKPSVSNNQVDFTPIFGTTANTFAQGNDSRFHNAVTIGTSNGLSLASQVLSLATATSSTSGAMSAADKSKLDGIAAGANTGTVTSIAISVPSAFAVSNSPVTTSGTINISATGNPLQYITGAGALATLNTGVVPENGNLYFTNARSRSAISVSGSLSYDSGTGVISYTTPSETDPVFLASAAYGITSTNISNWNTAYGWGNHASAGYLTSSLAATTYQPLDADLTAIAGLTGTSGLLKKTAANTWSLDTNTYLTSFTETDPIFVASAAYGITNTNISNWNTAYGWGNHASAGYLTSINSSQVTTALGYTPENAANKGIANGYASLDGAGLVPSTQLPSYVDDVLEYADLASLPATGTTGKIYVTLDTNKIYRWSGTVYVEISSSAGGGGTWGSITGTLSNQVDLQNALDAKQNSLGFTPVTNARTLTINGVTYDLTANRSWTVSGAMPAGGTAGQILSKIDATDYNTQWIDNFASQLKHEVKLGGTIAKGKAVYVSGGNGTNMIVSVASNASEATSSKTLGLLETGGVLNDPVKVITEGLLAGLDTSTATAGDPVWLGTNGDLIFGLANKPVAPAHLVFIGIVTRVQSNNGEIFVKVQNGFEIEELHNVLFTSKADKDLMYYDNATSLWKNAQLTSVLGYTPYNATNPSNYIALTGLSSTATGLTYTNTTGVFSLTSGYVIPTTTEQSNWNTAYGWGNHASAGYLTTSSAASTYQPLDADLTAIAALAGTSGFLKKTAANTWSLDTNTYLTSFTETDPIYTASSWYSTTNNASNWNTAYGWGNHASAGYLTTSTAASTYQPLDADLTAIAGLTGTSGFLKKTAANTWSLDTNTYLTSISSSDVTTALGYTPVTNARTLTINGTTYDLSADRSWTIPAGTVLNGTGFVKASGTTITYDNSTYVPTNGTGATGTWGISISGSAGSVGGIDISRIVYGNGANKTSSFSNANDALSSGFYNAYGAGNMPFTSWFHLLTSRHDNTANNFQMQFAGDFWDNNIYTRKVTGSSSSTTSWARLLQTISDPYAASMNQYVRTSDSVRYAGLQIFSTNNSEPAGGMRIVTHSVNKVGSSKFLKIYAGVNNYFTGFIFGYNFDNYPPNSATNTGAGFSYQFGGWSDGSGSHGDKFFDLTHFGGNNVGNLGREMNTDGNGYIITTPTSTGAGGYKASATIMIFARDMSQLTFTYY